MKPEKQEAIIYARVPHVIRVALEQERKRMSKAIGAEVKTSAVIRSILERALTPLAPQLKQKRRSAASESAA